MTSAKTVSVVIPAYKSAAFLAETLRSVQAQTHPPTEIIVVDDGSPDHSAEVAASFPGVACIRQSNQGVCAARNAGLKKATGEYVIFLDGDDRLLPDAAEVSVRELEAHPDCAFVFGYHRDIDQDGNLLGEPLPPGLAPESRRLRHTDYASLLSGHAFVPPAVACFRRSAAEAVGGFEVGRTLADDYEFYLRVARKFPFRCHHHVVADYRAHPGNTYNKSATANLLALLETLDRHLLFNQGQPELEQAIHTGKRHWARIVGPSLAPEMVGSLVRGRFRQAFRAMLATARYHPRGFLDYTLARLRRGRVRTLAPRVTCLWFCTDLLPDLMIMP